MTKNFDEIFGGHAGQVWRSVCQTYEAIASDLDTDDKEVQVECTLDANRVATFGGDFGPQADELIRAACKEHGWDVVCRVVAAKWLY